MQPSTYLTNAVASKAPSFHLPVSAKELANHEPSQQGGASSAADDHSNPVSSSSERPSPATVSRRFGKRLRELRRERNLTQVRMAMDFGIDRSFISDVERGKKSISLAMLEVIALGMKITLSELLRDI